MLRLPGFLSVARGISRGGPAVGNGNYPFLSLSIFNCFAEFLVDAMGQTTEEREPSFLFPVRTPLESSSVRQTIV